MAADAAGGVDDAAQPGRGVQHVRVQGRAAPAGDQQFGVGEHGAGPGGGQVVQHRERGQVAQRAEGRQEVVVEDRGGGGG